MERMKIALITGGNRGIGRSAAEHLAADGVGVVLTYNAHAEEAEAVAQAIGGVALQLDVTNIGDFPDRLREALKHWDRDTFDFLVNNGGFSRGGLIADVTEQDVDDLFAVHFKGPLFLTQALLPLLADGGRIVNLSSGLARFTSPQRAAYGSIKAAVEMLTQYMAAELGARGITANVIAPGAVATDFSDGLLRDNPDFQAHIASLTALGRSAVADDIGPAIANLLREGNHWITGQRIEVSGGLHL
jgi:NAD(P)-dependent dehydrogenase (short-subunit alcohol dehydrogenase family)